MAGTHHSIRVPLGQLDPVTWGAQRRREPITIGVPLPAGQLFDPGGLEPHAPFGPLTPAQVRVLDRWSDGSIRWALVDVLADVDPIAGSRHADAGDRAPAPLARVLATEQTIQVETGAATFGFTVGGPFPISSSTTGSIEPLAASEFSIETGARAFQFRIAACQVHETGPNRVEIDVRASAPESPIDVSARVELFAGSATVRVEITLLNTRRAHHPGGQWVLGDAGSVLLRAAVWRLTLAGSPARVRCAPEFGVPLEDVATPFALFQASSGGDAWNGPIHRARDGLVPLRFRGYRLASGGTERTGLRATPIVVVKTDCAEVAVALPHFWQNAPRAIGVDRGTLELGLFPAQSDDLHELQGGEQKTHTVVVAFGRDTVSDPPLAWCHDPLGVYPPPDWNCATGAAPFLIPAVEDPNDRYLQYVSTALDPDRGFDAKNERADEYGWRHFGDLHADHESAFQPPDRPFVSHYNNQYDAMASFGLQFLRTGDARWRRLMVDLARHVRDIDIYRTREDKAAYNGGLFWHTSHYTDAGTATHRTYPRGSAGGGPSAEHNYNAGLMLHYFMTGERGSREAAIGLGRWVIDMDDGQQTMFRWLSRGATGLASASGSMAYHGPGRGSANSILACLVAARLTAAPEYSAKADELIRRCIHPADDVDARNLHDAERRWYYTVFLQTLGWYLHHKAEAGRFDEMYVYARDSLLRYARWMALHERPYLDRPEVLEFPTETWAAQDIRKADVFLWAAQHAGGEARAGFLERAQFFFDYSVSTLADSPSGHFTRPLILLIGNGMRHGWVRRMGASLPPSADVPTIPAGLAPAAFEPQKTRAKRRAGIIVMLAVAAVLAAVVSMIG